MRREPIELRASRAPLAFQCPGSIRPATVPISEDGYPAKLGRAAHEALRALAESGSIRWADLPAIAAHHGVELDELRVLCGLASKLWPSLSPSFPDALTELGLSAGFAGSILTGHVDLLSTTGKVARVGDWKTGRKDTDYSAQMKAYGALVMLDNPELDEVTVTLIWVRDGEIENYTMRRPELRAWLAELADNVIVWDGVYHPGAHCGYCPRSHECAARTALVQRDVKALLDPDAETDLARMTPADVIEMRHKIEIVERVAKRVNDAIKAHIEAHGDIVGGGVRLTLESRDRRELDTAAAWPVLEALGFADEDFAATVDVPISRVEKRIAEKAGCGNGAAAVRELTQKLDDAGAVSIRRSTFVKEKRSHDGR